MFTDDDSDTIDSAVSYRDIKWSIDTLSNFQPLIEALSNNNSSRTTTITEIPEKEITQVESKKEIVVAKTGEGEAPSPLPILAIAHQTVALGVSSIKVWILLLFLDLTLDLVYCFGWQARRSVRNSVVCTGVEGTRGFSLTKTNFG